MYVTINITIFFHIINYDKAVVIWSDFYSFFFFDVKLTHWKCNTF